VPFALHGLFNLVLVQITSDTKPVSPAAATEIAGWRGLPSAHFIDVRQLLSNLRAVGSSATRAQNDLGVVNSPIPLEFSAASQDLLNSDDWAP